MTEKKKLRVLKVIALDPHGFLVSVMLSLLGAMVFAVWPNFLTLILTGINGCYWIN